jgi:hypothetical protein
MADGTKTLGQRIVEAARLAMIAHLSQQHQQQADPVARRREAVGGADPSTFKDEGQLPPVGDGGLRTQCRRQSSPSFVEGGAA